MKDSLGYKTFPFSEMLIEKNDLDRFGFDGWLFCRGMLFKSRHKWWGDHGPRDFPHEGVDVCLYRDRHDRIQRLHEKIHIPAMANGVVRAIFTDYLGKAVIVEHENRFGDTPRILSVYAHTTPRSDLGVGSVVKEGEIIASIADTSGSKSNILPHLHFSLGLPSATLTYDAFEWNVMRMPDKIALLDPMEVIVFSHRMVASDIDFCRGI